MNPYLCRRQLRELKAMPLLQLGGVVIAEGGNVPILGFQACNDTATDDLACRAAIDGRHAEVEQNSPAYTGLIQLHEAMLLKMLEPRDIDATPSCTQSCFQHLQRSRLATSGPRIN